MDIGLVIRPRPGTDAQGEVRAGVERLRADGHRVLPRLTFEGGDGQRYAGELAAAGVDLVVAVGGDGTVNEVVNGIFEADASCRLGIIPTGTANDFARGLGLPEEVGAALSVAVDGVAREVDIGRLNERWFVNVSTGGFGASATEETPADAKRLLGPLAYVITGMKKFSELRPSRARFTTPDGDAYDGPVMLFAVGNGRQTGAGSLLTPRAELDDGKLDVVIVPEMPRMNFVALAPDLRSGAHIDHPDVVYFQAESLEVESDNDLSVNVDGEPVLGHRFQYSVADSRLQIMVPASE